MLILFMGFWSTTSFLVLLLPSPAKSKSLGLSTPELEYFEIVLFLLFSWLPSYCLKITVNASWKFKIPTTLFFSMFKVSSLLSPMSAQKDGTPALKPFTINHFYITSHSICFHL